MPEDIKLEAENEVVEVENEEQSPSSEAEDTDVEVQNEVLEEQPKKPTRAERRIRQMSEKLQEQTRANEELKQELFAPKGSPELFTPGEDEIDPAEFQRRIDGYVENKVQRALKTRDDIESYQRSYQDHVNEIDSILIKHPELNPDSDQHDPVLESKFLDLYEELNTVQRGKERVFAPRKKPQDIVNMLLDIRDGAVARKTSEISGKLAQQVQEGAVSTSATSNRGNDYEAEDLFNKAASTGSDETWKEYLKKVM
jgi:hypothetical protein